MIKFVKNILFYLVISLILSYHVFSQKEAYNWHFGTRLGFYFNTVDTIPRAVDYTNLWATDACSAISDSNGNLLMYTNGDFLFNFNHDTLYVLNDTLRKDSVLQSRTNNILNGSTLILPKPDTDSLYYVIHTIGNKGQSPGLFYTTFDMKNNRGRGELWDSKKVINKKVVPYALTATRHGNRRDFWVATIDDKTRNIYIYHARNKGIYIGNPTSGFYNWFKENHNCIKMKFSPNGDKLAVAYYLYNPTTRDNDPFILVLDFDNYTSLVKNPIILKPVLDILEVDSLESTGVEFSTDSKRVFAFGRQYNLDAGTEQDIQNSEYIFYNVNKTFGNVTNPNKSILNDYQLSPDGRIFITWKDTVDIIFEPGGLGNACNFVVSQPPFVAQLGPPWIEYSEALPIFPTDFFKYEIVIQNNLNKKKWIRNDIEICEAQDLHFQTNELLRSKYSWTGPGGFTSNIKDAIVYDIKPSQTGWYKVRATRNYGEVTEDSIYVKVKPLPPTRLEPKGLVEKCKYTPMTLSAEPDVTGNMYFWSTGETSQTISIDSAGKYNVTIVDSAGCSRTDSIEVSIKKLYPEVEIIGEQFSCEGDTVILRTKIPYAGYIWTTGDSTRDIILTTSTKCVVEAIDSNGCAGYSDEQYIIFYLQPKTILKGSRDVCVGSTQKYCIVQTKKDSVIWEVSGGNLVSTIGTDTIIVEWLNPGQGKVIVKQISNKGCVGADSAIVIIDDFLKPEIIPTKPVICGDGTLTLRTSEQYDSYEWSTGETSDTIVVSSAGEYFVKVTAVGGCTGYDTVNVIKVDEPVAVIVGTTILCKGESSVLSVDGDFAEYLWSTGETTKDISVNQTGNYSVEVTDTNGCKASASVDVKAVVITLDGLNDTDFGRISIDNKDNRNLILTNKSNESIRFEDVRLKSGSSELSINVSPQTPAVLDSGDILTINISFEPDNMQEYTDSLIIEVSQPCEENFAANVTGIGTGKMLVWLPDFTKEVGYNICLPLYAKLMNTKPITLDTKFDAEIRYDVTALKPNQDYLIAGAERVINYTDVDLSIDKDTSVIAELCGTVLLARENTTPIFISDFTVSNPYCEVETLDGSLTILGCAIDISRIMLMEPLDVMLSPNPGEDEIDLSIKSKYQGQIDIRIYNTLGNLVYTENVNKTAEINNHSIGLDNFGSGLYFYYILANGAVQFKGSFLVNR